MKIYEQQIFQINKISDIKLIDKKFPDKNINILHSYKSIIWQGPDYVKTLAKKLRRRKTNYIIDLQDNIGLILALLNSQVDAIAVSNKINKVTLKKILSIAVDKKIKILKVEKLKIEKLE
tara:strand:- start:2338 stop:2697 length:360 start_codon:yes stop_codon:yes gene_type:complete